MKRDNQEENDRSFLFQVDILVNARTNGAALEHLLHILNSGEFADFRVGSGIMLGQTIDEALKREKKTPQDDAPQAAAATDKAKSAGAKTKNAPAPEDAAATKSATDVPLSSEMEQRIGHYIETKKLIRLNVNKGRGVKLSIPCRIFGFDAASQLLTVYHVDEKQVHTFKLFEIDDFLE